MDPGWFLKSFREIAIILCHETKSTKLLGIRREEGRKKGSEEERAGESAADGSKRGVKRCDVDISHSSTHSIVAVVTKGTLIYPISRSLQLSHNVTASCSPVTCSWFVCVCVCVCVCVWEVRRERGCICVRECVCVRDGASETECLACVCVCVQVCVRNDSSASCSLVKMTRSCQINIITIRV